LEFIVDAPTTRTENLKDLKVISDHIISSMSLECKILEAKKSIMTDLLQTNDVLEKLILENNLDLLEKLSK